MRRRPSLVLLAGTAALLPGVGGCGRGRPAAGENGSPTGRSSGTPNVAAPAAVPLPAAAVELTAAGPAAADRPWGEPYAARVRSTFYYAGERHSDPDTDAGRSATGVRLRVATATQVGVCAVDPAVIPYGSRVIVPTADGLREYLAADTGGAVKRERASRGSTAVIDFYSRRQVGGDYQDVTVVPYRGAVPFAHLSMAEKRRRLDETPGRP